MRSSGYMPPIKIGLGMIARVPGKTDEYIKIGPISSPGAPKRSNFRGVLAPPKHRQRQPAGLCPIGPGDGVFTASAAE